MRKTLETLTEKEYDRVMKSDMVDTYMYLGKTITEHCDTSMCLCDIYEISGCDEKFDNILKVYERIKEMFIKETKDLWDKRKLPSVFVLAHIKNEALKEGKLELYYEGGLHGIGQSLSYHATNIDNAWWFYSVEELCDFLKMYCYRDEAVIKQVDFREIYERLTGSRLW